MTIEKVRKTIDEEYNIIENCLNASTEKYYYTYLSVSIECEARLYFSGCGEETEYFDIPLQIILLDDEGWNKYLDNLKDVIPKSNLEYKETNI